MGTLHEEFPDDEIVNRLQKIRSILDQEAFDQKYADDCRIVLENIFKRKYYFEIRDEISQRKSVRTFSLKVFDADPARKTKFVRLCDSLQIELHDNSSNPSNGDVRAILTDFFDCLRLI